MFKAVWKLGIVDFDAIHDIRKRALVDHKGLSMSHAFDNNDQISAHLFVTTQDGRPIATARIYPIEHITRMGHIAVLPEFLGQGYEELALRMMLYKAQQLSPETIQAYLTEDEAPLYERLGFKPFSHDAPFSIYTLNKSDIDLSGTCHGC